MAGACSSKGTSESGLHKISGCNSSPTPIRQQPFDVFINHRGPDVKLNLASLIYHVLDLLGVKAFIDNQELDLGNRIPQAIENAMGSAQIHIAIFSKGYAESPWCLAELAFMVETGAPIIPVFYDVEPGDLKWGAKKLYGEAFSKHEKSGRYNEATLKSWKSAIHEASSRNGCEFKSNGDLGRSLRDIVERVQDEIKNLKVPFQEAQCPVGLDNAVENIESVIGSAGVRATVQIVGIVGMPGCGKTTLARELYNRKFKTFDKCSFLSEVSESNLSELQKTLLENILHLENIPMNDSGLISSTLAGRLRSSSPRVLIVLDDVDRENQLDALLPDRGLSLGSGSLVIVTTHDPGLLTNWGISPNSIHKMPKLDHRQAKELFCYHAFKGVSPPHSSQRLINKFVRACDGLPLSLKVIAGMVYGKRTQKQWESVLEKVSGLLPKDIKECLKISYETLDEQEKDIFLDVACFFDGEKKSLALAVWDEAKWCDLENLERKCLVEIDKQKRLRMHNHLRDLGREYAIGRSPHRLWSTEQMGKIMRYTEDIRGIMTATTRFVACPAHSEYPVCGDRYPPPFEECINRRFWILLKLLVVAGNCFTADFPGQSKHLVWLRWFDFQHTQLPSWLSLEKLRILELFGPSTLQQLWENNAQPPKELREMVITATEDNSFHNFPSQISGLEHLTKIALISYHGQEFLFTKLPDEFCNLRSLKHLELRYCKKLSKLPKHFGELKALRYLDLCSCQALRSLPDSFRQLTNLKYLDLSGCEKLSPMDIPQNMEKLEKLYFSGHAKLEELPMKIVGQKSLRDLRLDKTALMDVPSNIDQLSKLETLVIGSLHLTGLPESLGNLSSLNRLKITGCKKLEYLPESVDRLKLLEYLCIKSSGVKSLPQGFRQLNNLQYLKIIDCPIADLNLGSGSSSLCKLKAMHLKGTEVTSLSISEACCPNLETLELEQNYSLKEMDVSLKSVKMVKVVECTKLNKVELLNREILEITGCPEFSSQSTEEFICLGKRKRHEVPETSGSGRHVKFRIAPGPLKESQ